MWKSQKFILAAVLAAIMVIGGTAGVALAQEDEAGQGWRGALGDDVQRRQGALVARVAEILGIDQQQLEDAFRQAQSEFREEALDSRLEELIDEGTLTQEQADEFKAWIEARPDVPRFGPKGFHKLADEGILTQEQTEEYEAWMEARPDVPMPDVSRPRDGRFGPKGIHKLADEVVLTQEQLDQLEALKAEMRERMRDILGGDDGIPQTQ